MSSSVKNITLTSYEDIFNTNVINMNPSNGGKYEIPLEKLFSFENHPFQVRDDEAMRKLADSIRENGVLVPGMARPRNDCGYELIAGHRRKRACELAGIQSMPVIVKALDRDEATVIMVDSNLQRETILPSERAFAYKMKLEALNHRGVRANKPAKLSVEVVAEQAGESKNQIFRYIRLTMLIPALLDMVDKGEVAFNPAVELSYLKQEEQLTLLDIMAKEETTPSLSQAQRLKKLSMDGELTQELMDSILSEEKKPADQVTLSGDRLKRYFPESYTPKQMENTIIRLLERWLAARKSK